MANSILSSLSPAFSSGVNGFLSHLDEFNNFKNNFTGNPQVEAQKLLQSKKDSRGGVSMKCFVSFDDGAGKMHKVEVSGTVFADFLKNY